MNTAQGTLVLIDPQRGSDVYWNGKPLPATRVTVVEGKVFLHFLQGSVDADTLNALREAGIAVKETA